MTVTCLAVGSKVAHDGDIWTVVALGGERVTLEDHTASKTQSVRITHLLTAPGSRLLDTPLVSPVPAIGPLMSNLAGPELRDMHERAAHVQELLTGYRSGDPADALAQEPRALYAPGTPKMDRYRAKASELNVGLATIRRWVAAYEADGPAGLDQRVVSIGLGASQRDRSAVQRGGARLRPAPRPQDRTVP